MKGNETCVFTRLIGTLGLNFILWIPPAGAPSPLGPAEGPGVLLAEGALVSETVVEWFVCMAADTSAGGGWLDIVEWNRVNICGSNCPKSVK